MFRLQDNVPDIYVNESRDFQLFCRLYDAINNGVKADIDTIVNINVPFKANNQILQLLALKVGFITDKQIDSDLLRWIIASFPWAVKFKSSIYGIKLAVNTISKFENIQKNPLIIADHDQKLIIINSYQLIKNTVALDEFLKYIIPTGYTYEINLVVGQQENLTITNPSEITYFNILPSALALDDNNDTGYKKYTQIKVSITMDEKNPQSVQLTEDYTPVAGDYIGIGSVIGDVTVDTDGNVIYNNVIYVDKTLYYGTLDYNKVIPNIIKAGSILVNSKLGDRITPTYHIYVSETEKNILNYDYTQTVNTIHYYINPDKNANLLNPIVQEYIIKVPDVDINKYNHTLLTTQVADDLDYVYVIYDSSILSGDDDKPGNNEYTNYKFVYHNYYNKWWEFDNGEWKKLSYIAKIDNSNKDVY